MVSVKSSAQLVAAHDISRAPATQERYRFIIALLIKRCGYPTASERAFLLITSAGSALRWIVRGARPHRRWHLRRHRRRWRQCGTGCGNQPHYVFARAGEGDELRR